MMKTQCYLKGYTGKGVLKVLGLAMGTETGFTEKSRFRESMVSSDMDTKDLYL
jgi:hypothetical protein